MSFSLVRCFSLHQYDRFDPLMAQQNYEPNCGARTCKNILGWTPFGRPAIQCRGASFASPPAVLHALFRQTETKLYNDLRTQGLCLDPAPPDGPAIRWKTLASQARHRPRIHRVGRWTSNTHLLACYLAKNLFRQGYLQVDNTSLGKVRLSVSGQVGVCWRKGKEKGRCARQWWCSAKWRVWVEKELDVEPGIELPNVIYRSRQIYIGKTQCTKTVI